MTTPEGIRPPFFSPGTYKCTWSFGNKADVPGEIVLEGNSPPRGNADWTLGTPQLVSNEEGGLEEHQTFPIHETLPVLRGSIRGSGQDIYLVNARLYNWFPGSTIIDFADFALVGFDLEGKIDAGFRSAIFQTTGLDSVVGTPPLARKDITPVTESPKRWIAYENFNSTQAWSHGSAEMKFEYKERRVLSDLYAMNVHFSPTLRVELANSIRAEEWFSDWCTPLLRIISAGTGRAESVTFFSFVCGNEYVTAFGGGIAQRSYCSDGREIREFPSAFTTNQGRLSLLDLVRGWQRERTDGNPLVEGYNLVSLNRQQHPRSRVLLLLQFLEALFGFQNRAKLDQDKEKHLKKRDEVLGRLETLKEDGKLSSDDFRFAKKAIAKNPPNGLDSALRFYFESLPDTLILDRLRATSLIQRVSATQDISSLDNALRVIRNKLSHGEVNYPAAELDEISHPLGLIVRAVFLRTLGCGEDAVHRVLRDD